MRWNLPLTVLLSSLLVACGVEPGANLGASPDGAAAGLSGNETRGPLPAGADLATPPAAHLSFGFDWREHVNGVLYQGGELSLSVDPGRFPSCGTWGRVFAGVLADGEVFEVALDQGEAGRHKTGRLTLPRGGADIQVWLWTERDDGCVEYDSDFGHNYLFEVRSWQPGLVRFSADWSETVVEPLVAGGQLVIDYAWERLPECRVIYRGFPGWDIKMNVAFDGEWQWSQSVVLPTNPSDRERVMAVFQIPDHAREIEIYADNDQYPPTCHTWDSDYGRNYHFTVAP